MGAYFASAIKDKEDRLEHHGVLGQKWGIRRYQNKDGSLTAEGRKRAGISSQEYKSDTKKLKNAAGDVRTTKQYYDASKKVTDSQKDMQKWMKAKAMSDLFKNEYANDLDKYQKLSEEYVKKYGNVPVSSLSKGITKLTGKENAVQEAERLVGEKKLREKEASVENQPVKSNSPTEEHIRETATTDTYGFLNFKSKTKLPVTVNIDDMPGDGEKKDEMIKAASKVTDYIDNKENLNKVKDKVVENMINDEWGDTSSTSKEALKDNLKVYGMYVAGSNGDTVYGEVNCEHRNFNGASAPYGDHSIDVEFTYDTKNKKMTLSGYNSING